MVYLITYDLHKIKDYTKLHERILKLENCIRPLESFWMVETNLTLDQLTAYIRSAIDVDDEFYLTTIDQAGGGTLSEASWKWINAKFPLRSVATGISPLPGLGKLPVAPVQKLLDPNTKGLKPLGLHKLQQQKLGNLPLKPR